MREIASPLSGPFTTFGQTPIDIYKVGAYRPELAYSFYNEYYRRGRQPVNFLDAITHTRNGNATMTDSSGNIVWAPHNLLTYSEDFSSVAWTKTATDVTPNAAVAPDGTQTADKISHTSTSSSFLQTTSQVSGAAYKFGIFIKSVDHQWVRIVHDGSSVWVDTTNIVVGTDNMDEPTSVLELTDGWLYIVVSNAYNGASSNVSILLADGDNSATESSGTSAYIWGAHLYRSDLGGMADVPADERVIPTATKYVPTTDAARYLPRVNHHAYNGSQWVNKGLLHESEARTNLVTSSHTFSTSPWTDTTNLGTVSKTDTGPDGDVSASTIVDNGATGTGSVHIGAQFTVSTSTTYTFSVYAKADQLSWMELYTLQFTTPGNGGTYFDLSSGSIGATYSGHTANIEDAGNGWYRCSITFTTDATDTTGNVRIRLADGNTDSTVDLDGTSSILIYGAQLEAASTPSSYIPTNGSSATRASETLTIPSANLPWPNPVYVTGEELVTNGVDWTGATGNTPPTGWTKAGSLTQYTITAGGALQVDRNGEGGSDTTQAITTVSGNVYEVSVDINDDDGGNVLFNADGVEVYNDSGTGAKRFVFVAADTSTTLGFRPSTSTTQVIEIDNISVKEINPLALSIQMKGEMTYADEGAARTVEFFQWEADANNEIYARLDTRSGDTGQPEFLQIASGVADLVSAGATTYSPDINVPFNISSRHGSTFINGAVGGTSLTEDTTPTALPDLSATDLQLGYDMMGTISLFRIWGSDIGDDGISEAST